MFGRPQFLSGGSKTLPLLAIIAALAYLVFVAISAFQPAENLAKSVILAAESAQQTQEKINKKQMDFMLIKDWHLFGQPVSTAAQDRELNEEPQETELQLRLLGVFFLPSQPKTSYAIIETDGHTQKNYRLGDGVQSGITVHSILKEQVILLRNNVLESLSMKKTKLLAKT